METKEKLYQASWPGAKWPAANETGACNSIETALHAALTEAPRARKFTVRQYFKGENGTMYFVAGCWCGEFTRKEAQALVDAQTALGAKA